jgi:hypothetical protein
VGWADFSKKISAPHPFMMTYQLIPLSARSISLDSTFKEIKVYEELKEHAV